VEQRQKDLEFKNKIHEIKAYVKFLWSKKMIISITAIIFGSLFFFKATQSKTTYTSKLSFMLESQKGVGGLAQTMSLVQSFGLSSSNNHLSSDKIQELLKSKRIVINTLLLPYPASEISEENYCNYWLRNNPEHYDSLINIRLNIRNYEDLTPEEVNQIFPLYEAILTSMLNTSVLPKSDIFDLQLTSNDEKFSYYFVNDLLKILEEFYLTKTVEKEQITYDIIKNNIDSVKEELLKKEAQLAEISDQSNNIVKSKGHIKKMILAREIQILNLMYAESIKSLEMAKFSLLQKKPILQIIDYPQMPLLSEKDSKLIEAIVGIIIGVILSIIFFVLQRFYIEKLN
jgi:capsule polysaccharide export protein KpsE/RkpR